MLKSLTRFVLEFHHSLHRAVVVEDIEGANHLCALEVSNAKSESADHVTPN